jgi:hypothetical protein
MRSIPDIWLSKQRGRGFEAAGKVKARTALLEGTEVDTTDATI